MNTHTVKELHAIARTRGLTRYSKLRKAELVALLEAPPQPVPAPGAFTPGALDIFERQEMEKTRSIKSKIEPRLPAIDDMNAFERQEMARTRPAVKSKLREWSDWLMDAVPESIKKGVNSVYNTFKNNVMNLYNRATGATLHDEVQQEAREDHAEDGQQSDKDFTPQEHKQAHGRTFRGFRIPGMDGTGI